MSRNIFLTAPGFDARGIKSPLPQSRGLSRGEPGGDLLSRAGSSLSSARSRFTVLFGMGRGGSETLWPPSVTGCGAAVESHVAKTVGEGKVLGDVTALHQLSRL